MVQVLSTPSEEDSSIVTVVSNYTHDSTEVAGERWRKPEHSYIKEEKDKRLTEDKLSEGIPEFSKRKKTLIVFVVALAGLVGPIATNIFVPSLDIIRKEFDMSESVGNLTVTVFMVFLGIAPLFWGPASDKIGRRVIYLISISIFIVGSIACAFSVNGAMMIGMRGIQAIGASAVLAIGAGTISDIFEPLERGTAFGLYFIGPLLGPVLGPVVGGILGDRFGWRMIFFVLAGFGAFVLVSIILTLPETMPEIRMRNYARKNHLPVPRITKQVSIIQPLLLLRYPSALMVILYACSILASVYSYTTSVPIIFRPSYHLDTTQVGLLFLSSGIGNIFGSIIGGRIADHSLRKLKSKSETRIPPEARFNLVWFGSTLFPLSLLCYALPTFSLTRQPTSWTFFQDLGLVLRLQITAYGI
ncbi:Dityrosine transporter 1, variant 2 [Basidiobolus ranarum]|uniref:Dityrosine transporter 1, variant 2 n=1 Tax=Basidiobolus ranarum TaxID=34480 RepID=A0ABR2WV24_9FUNG